MNLEKTRHWSELVKNYFHVIAIIVGAWWTYILFIQKDAPLLEARGNATSEILWFLTTSPNENEREVVFLVILANTGSSSFDISKIRVRGWEFDFGNHADRLAFFDPEEMQEQEPFFKKTYDLTSGSGLPFPSHYPPGASMKNSFVWLIKPDCKKRIYFAAEFFKKGDDDAPNWFTHSWTQECTRHGEAWKNAASEPPVLQ
jgi:hypothetical protein